MIHRVPLDCIYRMPYAVLKCRTHLLSCILICFLHFFFLDSCSSSLTSYLQDCQRKDWKVHKTSCRNYKAATSVEEHGRHLAASRYCSIHIYLTSSNWFRLFEFTPPSERWDMCFACMVLMNFVKLAYARLWPPSPSFTLRLAPHSVIVFKLELICPRFICTRK